MTTPIRHLAIAPVLDLGSTAEGPSTAAHHAAAGTAAGPHFIAVLNAALRQLEHTDDGPVAPADPGTDMQTSYGPLIVAGVVLPGLRFGG